MIVWLLHCVISNCTRDNILVNMKIIKNRNSPQKNQYEHRAWSQNRSVFGVDEVGRGCLAGPIVTAACMLQPYTDYELLQDSKTLTQKELDQAYTWLTTHSSWAVSIIHHRIIDQHNIYRATQLAMKRSIIQLLSKHKFPLAILIDAVPLNLHSLALDMHSFNYGESLSISIAAASIIAKVTRDALIDRLDQIIPGYNLAQHKGYGTADHTNLVSTLGPSIIHRNTFINPVLTSEPEKQASLFSL